MGPQVKWTTVLASGILVIACQRAEKVETAAQALLLKAPGESQPVTAKVFDQHHQAMENAAVTYLSEKPEVATVDATGNVTARKSGTTRVTAKSGNKEDSVAVDVRIPGRIQTAPELKIEGIGATAVVQTTVLDEIDRPIAGEIVTLTVADPSKATVQHDGRTIETAGAGETVISATCEHLSTPIKLTVVLPDFGTIAVDPTDVALKVAGMQQLTSVAKAADGTPMKHIPFTYSSSDPALATVDSGGLVTAVAAGQARIVVGAADKSATVTVTIKAR